MLNFHSDRLRTKRTRFGPNKYFPLYSIHIRADTGHRARQSEYEAELTRKRTRTKQDVTKFIVKKQRSYCKLQHKPYNQSPYDCTRIPLASIPPLCLVVRCGVGWRKVGQNLSSIVPFMMPLQCGSGTTLLDAGCFWRSLNPAFSGWPSTVSKLWSVLCLWDHIIQAPWHLYVGSEHGRFVLLG